MQSHKWLSVISLYWVAWYVSTVWVNGCDSIECLYRYCLHIHHKVPLSLWPCTCTSRDWDLSPHNRWVRIIRHLREGQSTCPYSHQYCYTCIPIQSWKFVATLSLSSDFIGPATSWNLSAFWSFSQVGGLILVSRVAILAACHDDVMIRELWEFCG